MEIFQRLESEVRSYCRSFPTVFTKAHGCYLQDEKGQDYLDFFAAAGALNYGHNNEDLQKALVDYIQDNGVTHSLDMATHAKGQFLKDFEEIILKPRGMDYKVMFPGPTGTNAVEAALKLARKVTGRTKVVSFTQGFHGMTLGSLAVTGNGMKRAGAGIPLAHAVSLPFDGYFGPEIDTIPLIEKTILDSSSGMELPAAFILESIQAEGGVNVASDEWLQGLAQLARKYEILLILDDIQVGCGRTGPFFSFEPAGIEPDIICLSKSLSGFGLPMAITLMRPELDVWAPGEHNGTFRGHNLAFVTATKALEYWENATFSKQVIQKGELVEEHLGELSEKFSRAPSTVRGKGLIQGLSFEDTRLAGAVSKKAFEHGLIIETAGANDEVLKVLPPLIIEPEQLEKGFQIIERSLQEVLA